MHIIRFVFRTWLVSIWLVVAFTMLLLLYPAASWARRSKMTRWWSKGLLACSGIKTRINGQPMLDGPCIWVANHVSWTDIFYINQVRAAHFIAKDDVRSWPLIGRLVAGVGTIFIERGNRHAVPAVAKVMSERLTQNEVVAFFPEGTTSSGFEVLPFKKALFEPAITLKVPVQGVVLRYFWRGERSDYLSYTGDQSFLQNIWRLWGTSGVELDMTFLPPVQPGPEDDRFSLGTRLEEDIREGLTKSSQTH